MWTAFATRPKQLPWQLCKPTLQAARCLWASMVKYETQAQSGSESEASVRYLRTGALHVHSVHIE